MLQLADYFIQNLVYESSNSTVYRGYRLSDKQAIICKMMQKEYPSASEIARFELEYRVTQAIDSPYVPKLIALEKYKQRPLIIMEDFGGQALSILYKEAVDLPTFFKLAFKICDNLNDIHQHRIIHKDINPANVVYNPQTEQLKIIDFGISTVLSREKVIPRSPNVLEGTLPYISPEQTGRMNRDIDYRTDFYSLGVLFYRLLTGELPFNNDDAMELIHCHLAKIPTPLHYINPEIPEVLSTIVLKLLAKIAEERYQSVFGLKQDLLQCWQNYQQNDFYPFPLAQHDIAHYFHIPQKLYGREIELNRLLATFERVSYGNNELMLVYGYSGIGKSVLIHEIHKPIALKCGYFISGKYDQFKRNIPYAAIIEAFQDLIKQLLTETEEEIKKWQQKLMVALGNNGGVIAEVIPEIEYLIAKPAPVASLPPAESQNRFMLVFSDFMQVFTQAEHPLVLFLDDLQWADSASLTLLKRFTTHPDICYLLTIGAYRDNEVFEQHPLVHCLEEIEQFNNKISEIALTPLSLAHLTALCHDTFYYSELSSDKQNEEINKLAQVVLQKTGGNPFFVNQFLETLHDEQLLRFDTEVKSWIFDFIAIQQRQMTDNVVDLLVQKIQKLPIETQQVLQLAACIGNRFDLSILAVVYEHTVQETAKVLWHTLQESYILPIGDQYKIAYEESIAASIQYRFLHDRVQQAAYALFSEQQKQAVHLKIGQLLYQNTSNEMCEDLIFDIVNQLNYGIQILPVEEYLELARLNAVAVKKAKASIAYHAAVKYCQTGLQLLSEEHWQTEYDLMLNLHVDYAECAYLIADLETAERYFAIALRHVHNLIERTNIERLKIILYTTQGRYAESLQIAQVLLKEFDIHISDCFAGIDFMSEWAEVNNNLQTCFKNNPQIKQIKDLINLPEVQNQKTLALVHLIARLMPAGYFINPSLFIFLVLRALNLTIKQGLSIYSSYIFCAYGILLCSDGIDQYNAGYECGELALELDKRLQSDAGQRSFHAFGTFINHFKNHANTNFAYLKKGFQLSLENGDVIYATYCLNCSHYTATLLGTPLVELIQENQQRLTFIQRAKDKPLAENIMIAIQASYHLLAKTRSISSWDDEQFSEQAHLEYMDSIGMKLPLQWFYLLRTRNFYLLREYESAKASTMACEPLLPLAAALLQVPEHYFLQALTLLALYPQQEAQEQAQSWQIIERNHAKVTLLMHHCEANFGHKHYLIAAEMQKVQGNILEAMTLYDQAIASAQQHGFLQYEGLANELALEVYLKRGQEKIAQLYFSEACYAYQRWGAILKVKQLETLYPQLMLNYLVHTRSQTHTNHTTDAIDIKKNSLLSTRLQSSFRESQNYSVSSNMPTSATSMNNLDFASIIKASQALAGEIDLKSLLEKLLHITLENAGAQRGVLLLQRKEMWFIEGELQIDPLSVNVLQNIPLAQAAHLVPLTVLNYVIRAKVQLVLPEAIQHANFGRDPYINQHQSQSVLCLPLFNQAKLVGLLYLENNISRAAFTNERIEILNLLSTQVAISLENARLYADIQESERNLKQFLEAMPVGVFVVDAQRKPYYKNRTAQRILGQAIKVKADTTHSVEEFSHLYNAYLAGTDQLYPSEQQPIMQALEGHSTTVDNLEIRHSDKIIPIEMWGTPVIDSERKQVKYAIAAFKDISERKQAENMRLKLVQEQEARAAALRYNAEIEAKNSELAKTLAQIQTMQQQLVESEKMAALGNLVAGVAHEINTPVGICVTAASQLDKLTVDFANVYKQGKMSRADLESYLNAAHQNSSLILKNLARAAELTKSFKQVSVDQSSEQKRIFALRDYVHDIIKSLQPSFKRMQCHFIVECSFELTLNSYPGAFSQVLTNLIMNSLAHGFKESQEGTITIKIASVSDIQPAILRIDYYDNGKGIAADVLPRIFEPFFTTNRQGGGTGLGLHIVYNLVTHKLNGNIRCESQIGQGTHFILDLPLSHSGN